MKIRRKWIVFSVTFTVFLTIALFFEDQVRLNGKLFVVYFYVVCTVDEWVKANFS